MIMVRINASGEIGFPVACWPQMMVKQSKLAVAGRGPEKALIVMCAVAVGGQYVICPLGETTPVYELPEDTDGEKQDETEEVPAELRPGDGLPEKG